MTECISILSALPKNDQEETAPNPNPLFKEGGISVGETFLP